jgi:two-component system, OmpR family, response regulator ResD
MEADKTLKKRILVVDDDFSLRELLEDMFGSEYDVIKAQDAKEARIVLRNPVDLIILDVMMPGIDGYAFCKEVKESIATKHIPVLMLTAKHRIPDMQPAIFAGIDEYLTKPFEAEYLIKRVKVLLEKIPEDIPEQGRLLRFGGGFHYVRKK